MGYRLPKTRKSIFHVRIDDTASQSVICVDNGAVSYIAIPVVYMEQHDKAMHDHLGWPSPSNPDRSCQLPPGCEWSSDDVNLVDEGYESIEVAMIDPPDGLSFTGLVGNGVISLTISPMCPSAVSDDIDVPFAAYAVGTIDNDYNEEDIQLRDVVLKGVLHIVAGPI